MAKLTLNDLSAGYRSVESFNSNFAAIETALENTLSRDGTAPNAMAASLDLGSNYVINMLDPVNNQDGATKKYVDDSVGALSDYNNVYLGAKANDPSTDNDGNALVTGALYYNTSDNEFRVFDTGTFAWSGVLMDDGSIISTITEIDGTVRSGDDLKLVTGTPGTANNFAMWNSDGDVVDSGVDAPAAPLAGTVATVAALTALTKASLTNGERVFVQSYSSSLLGYGGGWFRWNSSATDTANSVTIFASDEGGTGRWFRIYDWLTPEMAGAVGDSDGTAGNGTDDTAAFRLLGAVLEANNGGKVRNRQGAIYRIYSTPADTSDIFTINNVDGFEWDFAGSTLYADRDIRAEAVTVFPFQFNDGRSVRIYGGKLSTRFRSIPQTADVAGMRWFYFTGTGTLIRYDMDSEYSVDPIFVQRVANTDALTDRWSDLVIRSSAVNNTYACALADSGDDVRVHIRGNGCFRTLIFYGLTGLRGEVWSKNHVGGDLKLFAHHDTGQEDAHLKDVDLDYHCEAADHTPVSVSSIDHSPSGAPVIVTTAAAHTYSTGQLVTISGETGITPSINGSWIVTSTGTNTFTLNGTDGDTYSGTFGGTVTVAFAPGINVEVENRGEGGATIEDVTLRIHIDSNSALPERQALVWKKTTDAGGAVDTGGPRGHVVRNASVSLHHENATADASIAGRLVTLFHPSYDGVWTNETIEAFRLENTSIKGAATADIEMGLAGHADGPILSNVSTVSDLNFNGTANNGLLLVDVNTANKSATFWAGTANSSYPFYVATDAQFAAQAYFTGTVLQYVRENPRLRITHNTGTTTSLVFGCDSGSTFVGTETNANLSFMANNSVQGYLTTDGYFQANGLRDSSGNQVLGTRGAAVSDTTITYSSNDPSITPDNAVTIADGSAPTNAELLHLCVELKHQVETLKSRFEVTGGHGAIAD